MASLRELVWQRAGGRCEYCQLPQFLTILPHELDHIVAQQHRGLTTSENLCLACALCNSHKGPNLTGIDPVTQAITRLFHPRQDDWNVHFRWNGPVLEGLSPIGRTTIEVLAINEPARVLFRRLSIQAGLSPSGQPRA
jgi:hypothetical protein